jgi:hypothetical protein
MPEVGLQSASVVASIRQGVATGVAQHVRMDREQQLGPQSDAGEQGVELFRIS